MNTANKIPEWPPGELEVVSRCPVCGESGRNDLYEGLVDRLFEAPGEWTLYECENCRSGYLDPRPTSSSIGLAYRVYYTHHSRPEAGELSWLLRVRRALANGYRNAHFGTNFRPASRLGLFMAYLLPGTRANLDFEARGLSRPSNPASVLDVGCGSGNFVRFAAAAGWEAFGVDPDPVAVGVAQGLGLQVGLADLDSIPDQRQYDVITLSHVIEHVHDPIRLLSRCHALLKPTGRLWVETPNLNSMGHRWFGRYWRGLEPPRHLVLFNYESLLSALQSTGFSSVAWEPPRPVCASTFAASEAIEKEQNPLAPVPSMYTRARAFVAEAITKRNPPQREFLTLTAIKGPQQS